MTFLVDLPDLKAHGVTREPANLRAVTVYFNRELTNDELRWLHDHLRHGIKHDFSGVEPGCRYCDFDPFKEYSGLETSALPPYCEKCGFGHDTGNPCPSLNR
jgi:hypothetical protein